jgi:hypothetical protein
MSDDHCHSLLVLSLSVSSSEKQIEKGEDANHTNRFNSSPLTNHYYLPPNPMLSPTMYLKFF